jgi:Uma2 family endonuclease
MAPEIARPILRIQYETAAEEYLRSLPLEHFVEATLQVTQRKITLESLDLVVAQRPDVHVFNELLVQYPIKGKKRFGQVVPDNMVVIHVGPIKAKGSYDIPFEPVEPFLVLEYVSKSSTRKDYDDNREHYEKQLKVPYYLVFYPDAQELTLFRHTGRKFVTVKPNDEGHYPIPELELEVAMMGEWVRFWFRDQLLLLPGEMQKKLQEMQKELDQLQAKTDRLKKGSKP